MLLSKGNSKKRMRVPGMRLPGSRREAMYATRSHQKGPKTMGSRGCLEERNKIICCSEAAEWRAQWEKLLKIILAHFKQTWFQYAWNM
jgi:hypothetical protein